ncbi:MAG TPA: hypothetical protein VLG27_04890 [Candidatus Saccharimonadia bacterium]|nr:hypothetical protein [Candidatus Saccharimonadia bacterium]
MRKSWGIAGVKLLALIGKNRRYSTSQVRHINGLVEKPQGFTRLFPDFLPVVLHTEIAVPSSVVVAFLPTFHKTYNKPLLSLFSY